MKASEAFLTIKIPTLEYFPCGVRRGMNAWETLPVRVEIPPASQHLHIGALSSKCSHCLRHDSLILSYPVASFHVVHSPSNLPPLHPVVFLMPFPSLIFQNQSCSIHLAVYDFIEPSLLCCMKLEEFSHNGRIIPSVQEGAEAWLSWLLSSQEPSASWTHVWNPIILPLCPVHSFALRSVLPSPECLTPLRKWSDEILLSIDWPMDGIQEPAFLDGNAISYALYSLIFQSQSRVL